MQYKTIALELLEQETELHDRLKQGRRLRPVLEICAHRSSGRAHLARQGAGLGRDHEAGERPGPDSQRSAGTGDTGTGQPFTLRTGRRREFRPVSRRGDGEHQASHAPRG